VLRGCTGWVRDSGNTGDVSAMQERRDGLHGSEAVWVQALMRGVCCWLGGR
jgi:hypothetical protein